MKPFRRRSYAKACGFKLKREKDIYIITSRLSTKVYCSTEGTKGDRDDAVFNLTSTLSMWSYNNKKK